MPTERGFYVLKTASGGYRWFCVSSNNARDVHDEIVSKQALEMDVERTSRYGDTSELWLMHIKYRLGGAPDWRGVVEGMLVETGEFDDTPVAKAIAEWFIRNPKAPDGSDWGVSIGFWGIPNADGVYEHIVRMRERSVLPLSKAANPFTFFSVEEVQKMTLKAEQRALLTEMAKDPEAREAAMTIFAAIETSKALDEAGVQRKATEKAETPDPVAKAIVDPATKIAQDEVEKAAGLTDDDIADIAKFVEGEVKKAMDNLTLEVNKALSELIEHNKALQDELSDLRNQEKAMVEEFVQPRQSRLFDKLKSASATASGASLISAADPLAQSKPALTEDNVFAHAGLLPNQQ